MVLEIAGRITYGSTIFTLVAAGVGFAFFGTPWVAAIPPVPLIGAVLGLIFPTKED